MTGLLLSVAVVAGVAPEPPSSKVLNLEPVVVGAIGLVGVGLGAWRLERSGTELARLDALVAEAMVLSPEDRVIRGPMLLENGRVAHQLGTIEAMLGWSLLGLGSAMIVGSLVWLFVEGVTRPPLAVTPAVVPGGGAVVMQGRF